MHPKTALRIGRDATAAQRETADLRRRINGALHLLNQADPTTGAGTTAVLLADLRTTLTSSRDRQVPDHG